MRRLLPTLLATGLLLGAPGAASGDILERTWEPPVAIGPDELFESRTALGPLGAIVSVQQRTGGSGLARIGVRETNGRTRASSETGLWDDPSTGYYPRLAVSPLGTVATAFSDGDWVHVHVRRPGGEWHEVGKVYEGQTDYSDGRPLLAFTPLDHLVIAWPRKDAGGQRIWLSELAPDSDELSEPRPLDPEPKPGVVQVARDLDVSATGTIGVGYLQGPTRTSDLTARVAFGRLGEPLDGRHALPGFVTPWSWEAPQVAFDALGGAAVAWYTVPAGFDQTAALGDLHLLLRRPDGQLGEPADLGQTPGDLDLVVSALGEVILGYASASNLAGSGGSWSYSGSGYRAVPGSTVLGKVGTPALLVPWPGWGPRLGMNSRGDAIVAWEECCGEGGESKVSVRRRVPGGSFGDPAVAAKGSLQPAGGGGYYGAWVHEVGLDPIGNAMVSWSGFGPDGAGLAAAVDGPFLDLALPGLPLGLELPPILPPVELPPIEIPTGPVVVPPFPFPFPGADADGGRRGVVGAPLGLSVRALRVRGVPKRLRCDRACAVQAEGRVAGKRVRAFRGGIRARRNTDLRIAIAMSTRRHLRRVLGRTASARARITVKAVTAGGAAAQRTLRITLRRP